MIFNTSNKCCLKMEEWTMRWLGNYGTICVRVGVNVGVQIYWNHQWYINYKAANGKLLKTVKWKKS